MVNESMKVAKAVAAWAALRVVSGPTPRAMFISRVTATLPLTSKARALMQTMVKR